MVIIWKKAGKKISNKGTDITYQATQNGKDMDLYIESRKRHIPHANRSGTWEHTSYFVLRDGKELTEKMSLRAAKEYAAATLKAQEEGKK